VSEVIVSTEGKHRCGSCLQWVGTNYDGRTRPYRRWQDEGGDHVFCSDREACDNRWDDARAAERLAASEARIYDPEPDDDEEEDETA